MLSRQRDGMPLQLLTGEQFGSQWRLAGPRA
jgi:hypothetical protein